MAPGDTAGTVGMAGAVAEGGLVAASLFYT